MSSMDGLKCNHRNSPTYILVFNVLDVSFSMHVSLINRFVVKFCRNFLLDKFSYVDIYYLSLKLSKNRHPLVLSGKGEFLTL